MGVYFISKVRPKKKPLLSDLGTKQGILLNIFVQPIVLGPNMIFNYANSMQVLGLTGAII